MGFLLSSTTAEMAPPTRSADYKELKEKAKKATSQEKKTIKKQKQQAKKAAKPAKEEKEKKPKHEKKNEKKEDKIKTKIEKQKGLTADHKAAKKTKIEAKISKKTRDIEFYK